MKTNKWKIAHLKDLRLRIIRENLRTLLVFAIREKVKHLSHLENLYRQKRIYDKQVPSQWKRESNICDMGQQLMDAWSHSILRCSEGSSCKSSSGLRLLTSEISTLDKDMVWNPLNKHWICIDCYNFYYKSESAKRELENFLRQLEY